MSRLYTEGPWVYADCPDPRGKADAQLIAAAPELLEALEYIRDLGRDGASNKYARAQIKAERAIEKLRASHPQPMTKEKTP